MKAKGFTLVEILIVVVILGIMAAIVLPKFSNASEAARAAMLADDLRIIRIQIGVFAAQHNSVAPGYPLCDPHAAPTEKAFVLQMTMASDSGGKVADPGTPGFPYGPYLREIPINPFNGKNTVEMIGNDAKMPSEADDSHGWVYQPATQAFRADNQGTDEKGMPFYEY